jgi:hypothetical protein
MLRLLQVPIVLLAMYFWHKAVPGIFVHDCVFRTNVQIQCRASAGIKEVYFESQCKAEAFSWQGSHGPGTKCGRSSFKVYSANNR